MDALWVWLRNERQSSKTISNRQKSWRRRNRLDNGLHDKSNEFTRSAISTGPTLNQSWIRGLIGLCDYRFHRQLCFRCLHFIPIPTRTSRNSINRNSSRVRIERIFFSWTKNASWPFVRSLSNKFTSFYCFISIGPSSRTKIYHFPLLFV